MTTYLLVLTAILLVVLVRMTQISIRRKEPRLEVAYMGGITGACFTLLIFLIVVW